jgi:hypothetical protein
VLDSRVQVVEGTHKSNELNDGAGMKT